MVARLLAWSAVALAAPFPVPAFAADRVAEASSGQTPDPGDIVLFSMDEGSIPWRDNLKLTLQPPQKYPGNPVMKAGPLEGPDGYGVVLYGTVIKENGTFRMWYLASARPDSRIPGDIAKIKDYRPIAYAASRDGIHWRRPPLGLVEFRGSKDNNLVSISPSNDPYAKSYDFVAVLRDAADPDPERRYKMAFITHGQDIGAWPSTATAVSSDGLSWTLVNTRSFTKGHFENTSLIRFKGIYYLAGQDHPPYDAGLPDGSPAGRGYEDLLFGPTSGTGRADGPWHSIGPISASRHSGPFSSIPVRKITWAPDCGTAATLSSASMAGGTAARSTRASPEPTRRSTA